MKAIILIAAALNVFSFLVESKSVDQDDAKAMAEMFFESQIHVKSIGSEELQQIEIYESRFAVLENSISTNGIYIFSKDNQGSVIISTDDNTQPILGYTDSKITSIDDLPDGFIEIINNYQRQIDDSQDLCIEKSTNTSSAWEQYELDAETTTPLINSHWHQNNTYSSHCPYDEEKESNTLAGCVATAMAQILKYHNYPAQAVGFNSYYHIGNTNTFGDLSVDYAGSIYNWDNMPNNLNTNSDASQVDEVSKLIYHCGVAVGMNYDVNYSGAWVTEAMTSSRVSAEFALKSHFNYDASTLKAVVKKNYSDNEWEELIMNEIDNNRPVLFAGEKDNAGGHAFVIDGYNQNGLFHINWGWGGNADGYYAITALNPLNSGAYNVNQRALIGIQPNRDIDIYSLNLDSDIEYTINNNTLIVGASIVNSSDEEFKGQICGVLFDSESRIIDYLTCQELTLELAPGGKRQISVTAELDNPMLTGTYSFGIYYKSELMGWRAAIGQDDKCNTAIDLSTGRDVATALCINGEVNLSNSIIGYGETIEISTVVKNRSEKDYDGIIAAAIYTYDGTLVKDFGTVIQQNFKAGEDADLQIKTTSINAPVGEYYLVLLQKYKNSSSQKIVSANGFKNPQKIRIINKGTMTDTYESNDCLRDAYQIIPTFVENSFNFLTTKTQIQTLSDEDYYYIELPLGYRYTFSGRVNDKYSNITDTDYTCDVIWSHSIGDKWSYVYDDKIYADYKTENGGRIYIGVLPYSTRITGTYSLDITITREALSTLGGSTEIDNSRVSSSVVAFPNPVAEVLRISSPESIIDYELINSEGASLAQKLVNSCDFDLQMSSYTPGLYLLKLNNGSVVKTKQILVK